MWIARFNGMLDASDLMRYVVNVSTALSGLGFVAACVLLFSPSRGGYAAPGAQWTYSGPLGRRGGMYKAPYAGPNVPVFGTKKNPLPFRRPRHPFPWNINGLNVNGRATYKTKAWKPTNLAMSILRNGLVPGIVGWAQYRKGVKQRRVIAQNDAAGVKVDADTNRILDEELGGNEE